MRHCTAWEVACTATNFGSNTDLESVVLINVPITDVGVEHLATLPKLRGLYLVSCNVSDIGLERLSECATLVQLGLHDTATTAEGARKFKARRPHCQFTWHAK